MSFNNPSWSRWNNKTVDDFIPLYMQFLHNRDLSIKSLGNRLAILKRLSAELGSIRLMDVSPRALQVFISGYEERGTISAAQAAHMVIGDFFREAWIDGYVNYSPAVPLRYPKPVVRRSRLTAPDWMEIYDYVLERKRPYMPHAMRLAIATGQRRGDISLMRRSHIWDDHLHIAQQKTGFRLALPLQLRCPVSGDELGDIIERCPGSDYLLGNVRVFPYSLSTGFKNARNALYPDRWIFPPTFHEQRSLSERLYRPAGIDTQRLMGHKWPQTTDKYNFNRGLEWSYLSL